MNPIRKWLFAAGCLLAVQSVAQTKVANYYYNKAGTDQYEHISLWVRNGQRADISYAYGKDRKEVRLAFLGKDIVKGMPAFTVRFPNGSQLYLIPNGSSLNVTADKNRLPKLFTWEYEGPVNGIGTFCSVCAQDGREAMQLVRQYYLR
nr:hypothetical protein [uncultured Arsenicibacter sp.]